MLKLLRQKFRKISIFFCTIVFLSLALFVYSKAENTITSDLKIDLSILNLVGDNTNDQSEFQVKNPINAAADISISGNGSVIEQPWLVLKVPKTEIIQKPTFIDSQKAKRTLKYEDDNFYYVIYQFDTLSGGTRLTFPFPFQFELSANNDDKLKIEASFISGINVDNADTISGEEAVKLYSTLPVYKKVEKTYIAKKNIVPFNNTRLTTRGYVNYEKDTDTYVFRSNVNEGATHTPPNSTVVFALREFIEVPPDIQGDFTYESPTNTEVDVTLYDNMTAKFPGGYNADTRTIERKLENPNPQSKYSTADHWFDINFDNMPFNTTYELTFKSYVNKGLDNERTLPERKIKVKFVPMYFSRSGGTYFHKDNLSGDSSNPFKYNLYEGNYTTDGYKIYDIKGLDQTQNGLFYTQKVQNINNGSGYESPENGIVSDIYSITDYILDKDGKDTRLKYISYKFYLANSDETVEAFNNIDNTLYGIKRNGEEVVLARNIKYNQKVDINDENGDFYSLRLDLATPLRLNNQWIQFGVGTLPKEDEFEKFRNKTYNQSVGYGARMSVTSIDAVNPSSEPAESKKTRLGDGRFGYTVINPMSPKSYIEAYQSVTVPYSATGTYARVGFRTDLKRGNWGPLAGKPIENVKIIALLPPEFTTGRNMYNNKFYQVDSYQRAQLSEPEVVNNFKNTGRTAVIWNVESMTPNGNTNFTHVALDVKVSPYAKRDNNQIDYYLVYPDNNIIEPNSDQIKYTDTLDLDNDGDKNEVFVHTSSYINYIPPLELIVSKTVGSSTDSLYKTLVADMKDNFFYGITIFNNTIGEVNKVSIIDVLPYEGDHNIVANKEGTYEDRGSAYRVYLNGPLEDLEQNEGILDRFEFFYQTSPQGTQLSDVRDGLWLKKDQIEDFSQVRSVKVILKEGSKIGSKEEVKVYLPVRMPKTLTNDESTPAVNTTALSTDDRTYVEGNKANVYYTTYSVSGIVFDDKNQNGIKEDSENGVSNQTVELINEETGEVMKDQNDTPYKTTTSNDGSYSFNIYKRGNYRVRFTLKNGASFTPVVENSENGNHVDKTDQEHPSSARIAILSPLNKTEIRNAGIVAPPIPTKNITVVKKWLEHDSQPLSDKFTDNKTIEVELLRDGVVQEGKNLSLNKENNWTSTFTDLPEKAEYHSDPYVYSIREKNTDQRNRIQLDGNFYDVKIDKTGDNTYTITNKRQLPMTPLTPARRIPKVNITVNKKWLEYDGQPLSDEFMENKSIVVELLRDGEVTDKTVTLNKENNWTSTFENLLDKAEYEGESYSYTVREKDTDDRNRVHIDDSWYNVFIENNGENSYTITNKRQLPMTPLTPARRIPKVNITVNKKWLEYNNEALDDTFTENKSIVVELLRDGEVTDKTVTLNKENNWTSTFENLLDRAEYEGESYSYTVREKDTDDKNRVHINDNWYSVFIEKTNENEYTITNKRQMPMIPLTPAKKKPSTTVYIPTKPGTEVDKNNEKEKPKEDESNKSDETTVSEPNNESKDASTKNNEQSENTSEGKQSNAPNTGDKSIFAKVILLVSSLIVIFLLAKKRTKK